MKHENFVLGLLLIFIGAAYPTETTHLWVGILGGGILAATGLWLIKKS